MKRGSTLFLKLVVLLMGIGVFALCVFLVYELFTQDLGEYNPIVIGMLIGAIPYFVGISQAFKLLTYIDKNKAFSELSVKALKHIKQCGIVISALYAIGMPYIYYAAEKDDAPGVIVIGLVFTFAPLVIAVFAAVLQKLLQNAIDIKSENDLTV